ncbi:hypothetical protein AB0L40_11045 [Patulibacter sp. NPDC049589]|uniref:hypothetical protein n=1 Tax=Patulibacter sp. NPDC049589 TaxID=3154731 RepID=UPI003437B812
MSWLPLAVSIPAQTVVVLMAVAMVLAILGHLTRVRGLLASGILLLFLATFGMIIGGFGAWKDAPGPAPDTLRPTQLPPADGSIGDARRDAQRSVDKNP